MVHVIRHHPAMADEKTLMIHGALRLEGAMMARVDALIPHLGSKHQKASRSAVLRALCEYAVPLFEAEHGIKPAVDMSDPMRGKRKGGGK
jgi:hypothetical protein